ncbi:MAG TPA: sigma-70 family RNA polymerase sigma factor [Gammaproteobacteria bacterium]|nr:sigma-70 family RNA polymerase sigma factor [Gammaproteobacteria bacterium]
MDEQAFLAERFEAEREHLRRVAYRMLGSSSEAEDAVQESWLHLSREDRSGIENLRAWLTTVVARICLDMLRSRKARREESLDEGGDASGIVRKLPAGMNPEQEAALADSVGLAMLVVLDRLAPPERIAFVMHDMFGMPFEEIAQILGRTPAATRQIASRARRRVQGGAAAERADLARRRETVEAMLAALRAGDFHGLLAVLDPDVVVRSDSAAVAAGAPPEMRGAEIAAQSAIKLARGARFARAALVDGELGVIVAPRGRLFRALKLTFAGAKIARIEVLAEAERLRQLEVGVLAASERDANEQPRPTV